MQYEQWLAERKSGIGGSEAAIIMGKSPYMTNAELWEIKTGQRLREDISNKERVIYGKECEQYLIKIFELDYPEYEVTHIDYDLQRNKDYPFLFASNDAYLKEKSTNRSGFLEVKTGLIKSKADWEHWHNQIPIYYAYQMLHYFMVRQDFDFGICKAQLTVIPEADEETNFKNIFHSTRHYYYERADQLDAIDDLRTHEIRFWTENVLKNKRPPLILM